MTRRESRQKHSNSKTGYRDFNEKKQTMNLGFVLNQWFSSGGVSGAFFSFIMKSSQIYFTKKKKPLAYFLSCRVNKLLKIIEFYLNSIESCVPQNKFSSRNIHILESLFFLKKKRQTAHIARIPAKQFRDPHSGRDPPVVKCCK